jgi:hypothetical protein
MNYDVKVSHSMFILTDTNGNSWISNPPLDTINKVVAIRKWGIEILLHLLHQVRAIEYE